jgi:hypothetical protein
VAMHIIAKYKKAARNSTSNITASTTGNNESLAGKSQLILKNNNNLNNFEIDF